MGTGLRVSIANYLRIRARRVLQLAMLQPS